MKPSLLQMSANINDFGITTLLGIAGNTTEFCSLVEGIAVPSSQVFCLAYCTILGNRPSNDLPPATIVVFCESENIPQGQRLRKFFAEENLTEVSLFEI